MADERIDIEITDKVATTIAAKIDGIATSASKAFSAIEELKNILASINTSPLAEFNKVQEQSAVAALKSALAQEKLETQSQRTAVATASAELAALKLAAAQDKATKATSELGESEESATERIRAMVAQSSAYAASMNKADDATNKTASSVGKLTSYSRELLDAQNKAMSASTAQTKALIDEASAETKAASEAEKFIAKLRLQAETAGMSTKQLNEHKAAQLGVASQAAPFIQAMEKSAESSGKLSFANAGSTRELIVLGHEAMTGNFSRMPGSFMVLLERAGNLHAILNPVTIGFVALAVAAVGVAVAMAKGHAEMVAMNNALLVTSNYAGLSRAGMDELANSMTLTKEVTIGAAKEIVTMLVASGTIGSKSIETIAKVISDFAKSTGQDIDKVAPKLISLFEDPAKGAEQLDKQMHFLNTSELEHIRTLERLGKTQEAQQLLAEKLTNHIPKQVQNLGYLQKAYNEVASAISIMVDKLKQFGAEQTNGQEIQKLEELQKFYTKLINSPEVSAFDKLMNGAPMKTSSDNKQIALEQLELIKERMKILRPLAEAEESSAKAEAKKTEELVRQKKAIEEVNNSTTYQIKALRDTLELVKQAPDSTDKTRRIFEINKQIFDMYRAMGAEGRQLAIERINSDAKISEQKIKFAADEIETEGRLNNTRKLDLIDRMNANDLEMNQLKINTEQKLLAVSGLNKVEKQGHLDKIKQLKEEREAMENAGFNKLLVEEKKEFQEVVKAILDKGTAEVATLQKSIEAQKLHNAEIGKTKEQIALEKIAINEKRDLQLASDIEYLDGQIKKIELDEKSKALFELQKQQLVEELNLRKELKNLLAENSVKEANETAAKKLRDTWKDITDTVQKDLASAIIDGGGNGAQKLLRDLKTAFLRSALELPLKFVGDGVASLFAPGGEPRTAGGNPSVGSAFGAGGSILSGLSNAFAPSAGYTSFATSGLGQSLGLSEATINMESFTGALGAGESTVDALALASEAGSTALTGFGSMLGTAIPVVGAVVAAFSLLSGFFEDGPEEHTKLTFGSSTNKVSNYKGTEDGKNAGDYVQGAGVNTAFGSFGLTGQFWTDASGAYRKNLDIFLNNVKNVDESFVKNLSTAEQENITKYLDNASFTVDNGPEGPDPASTGAYEKVLADRIKNIFKALGPEMEGLIDNFKGTSQELATEGAILLNQRKNLNDYANTIGEPVSLKSLAALKKEGENAAAAIARVVGEFTLTNELAKSLGKDAFNAFGSIGLASEEMRSKFVEAAGGLQNFGELLNTYNAAFRSISENNVDGIRKLDTDLRMFGLSSNSTREDFAKVMQSFDLTSASGVDLAAQLLKLQGRFISISESIRQAGATIESAFLSDAEKQTKQIKDLGAEFNKLGLTMPTNKEELKALYTTLNDGSAQGNSMKLAVSALIPEWQSMNSVIDENAKKVKDAAKAIRESSQSYLEAQAKYNGASEGQIVQMTLENAFATLHEAIPSITSWQQAVSLSKEELKKLTPEQIGYATAVTNAASSLKKAAEVINNISFGQIQDSATAAFEKMLKDFQDSAATNNKDNYGGELQDTISYVQAKKTELETYRLELLKRQGGQSYGNTDQVVDQQITMAQGKLNQLIADLDQYKILESQYKGKGKDLLDLQRWYEQEQKARANNNEALVALQLAYETKRRDIINGSTKQDSEVLKDVKEGAKEFITIMNDIATAIDNVNKLKQSILDSEQAIRAAAPNFDAVGYAIQQVNKYTLELANAQLDGADIKTKIELATKLQNAIVANYNVELAALQKTQETRMKALQEAQTAERDVLESNISHLEEMRDALKDLAEYAKSMLLGALTVLSPTKQLDESERQYRELLAKAKSNDPEVKADAVGKLQAATETYLKNLQNINASNSVYAKGFNEAYQELQALGLSGVTAGDDAEKEKAKLAQRTDEWQKETAELQKQFDAETISLQNKFVDKLDALIPFTTTWQIQLRTALDIQAEAFNNYVELFKIKSDDVKDLLKNIDVRIVDAIKDLAVNKRTATDPSLIGPQTDYINQPILLPFPDEQIIDTNNEKIVEEQKVQTKTFEEIKILLAQIVGALDTMDKSNETNTKNLRIELITQIAKIK